MFKIIFANDTALTGMRAELMRNFKLFKSQNFISSLCQEITGSGTHGANTNYYNIKCCVHPLPFNSLFAISIILAALLSMSDSVVIQELILIRMAVLSFHT